MQATYSGDPATSAKDQVRFEIGDTVCSSARISDDEIEFYIAQGGPTLFAASKAADVLAVSFAQSVDEKIGNTTLSNSQLTENYRDMAKRLRVRAGYSETAILPVAMFVGGISKDRKEVDRKDTDLVQPDFRKGQFANPSGADLDPNAID